VATLALTRRALRDIEEIEAFSIEQWGKRTANEYLNSIELALDRLRKNPDLLKSKEDISERFKFYRLKRHLLICTQREQRIYVLAVRHGAMDLPTRVAELEPTLIEEAEMLHQTFLKRKSKRR
jgi:plasmid stabilization system protein ParE